MDCHQIRPTQDDTIHILAESQLEERNLLNVRDAVHLWMGVSRPGPGGISVSIVSRDLL